MFSSKSYFLPLILNKKKTKQNTTEIPHHSNVNSTQTRKTHFSFAWVMNFRFISSCPAKVDFFSITLSYRKIYCCLFATIVSFIAELWHVLYGATISVPPWKNYIKTISIYLIRKGFSSFLVIYCQPTRKMQPLEK